MVKGQGQRAMFGTNQSTKLPFYLGYILKVNVEVKGRGQRSGSQVEVKGQGQKLMSMSNIWHIGVD